LIQLLTAIQFSTYVEKPIKFAVVCCRTEAWPFNLEITGAGNFWLSGPRPLGGEVGLNPYGLTSVGHRAEFSNSKWNCLSVEIKGITKISLTGRHPILVVWLWLVFVPNWHC